MVEKLLEEGEEFLLDTPYLRRIRELGRQEGEQIGREEGLQTGVQIGREEGLQAVRAAILEGVAHKFNPSLADYRQLQGYLDKIHNLDRLQPILLALLDAVEIGDVLRLAHEMAT